MWSNCSLPGNDNTNVCVATHDRGFIEPKCHVGLQEPEAELCTPVISINDSKASKLVNPDYIYVQHASCTSVFSAMLMLRGNGRRLLMPSLSQNTSLYHKIQRYRLTPPLPQTQNCYKLPNWRVLPYGWLQPQEQ